tara:strand:+ start:251 stop:670 length:420 start_codon:yes stop_codon:yes gene_type:complete
MGIKMTWYYNNVIVEDAPMKYVGFVYEIHDTHNQRYYIGKKLLWTTKKLPPLKGGINKRHRRVETDWQDYYGSSLALNAERLHLGNQHFKRKILYLCENKNQMSYYETLEQFNRGVLFKDEYYNGIISCRISARGLKSV